MEKIKYGLFVCILGVILIPWLQKTFKPIHVEPVWGKQKEVTKPVWNWSQWFEGRWQEEAEKYYNQETGFRPWMVKFNNQLYYSLYGKAKANSVVIGKNNYLFAGGEIENYTGESFTDYKAMVKMAVKVKFIQDTLERRGKHFIFTIVPTKAYTMPEFLPENTPDKRKYSEYTAFLHIADSLGIHVLDLSGYYARLRQEKPYPVFSRGGFHWTVLGQTYAADTFFQTLGKLAGAEVPRIHIDSVYWSPYPLHTDNDLAEGLNLICIPNRDSLAYPVVSYSGPPASGSALFIGDSYFNYYRENYICKEFSEADFWYYLNEYFACGGTVRATEEVDMTQTVEEHKVFVVFGAHFNIGHLSARFADKFYPHFISRNAWMEEIKKIEDMIRQDPAWFEHVRKKAAEQNKPLDSVIRGDAIYQYNLGKY